MSEPCEPLVEVRNLRRRFGPVHAVRDLSFSIEPGQVVGFIGANGAGKTTTMRMMATLEIPDGGSIRIAGYDVISSPVEVRRRIGWMPDSYGTYDNMTVFEYLDFYARAFGFRGEDRQARVSEVMEFANLTELAERPMNKLSKGMGQRLCLGRTLLHDPPLLIMDEPAAGLDPKARIEFKNLVRLLAQDGKTLFISSHILSELGEMCDTLLFIDGGRLVHHGSSESLISENRTNAQVEIRVAPGAEAALREWISLNQGITFVDATRSGARVRIEPDTPECMHAILRKLVLDGIPVTEFRREERKLEDAFVEILGQQTRGAGPTPTAAPASPPPLPPPLPPAP